MKRRFLLFVSALLTAVGALAQASIILETLPESSVGQTAVLSMSLDNKEVVKGFQADVTLPDFITFNNVAPQMTAHAQAFDVAYRRISEHQMRIVVSSATNGKLQADSAAVVSFNVAVANVEDATGEVIKVTQAVAILENYRKVEIPDTAFQALAVKPSFVIRYVVDGEECYRDTLMQGEAIQPLATPTKEGHTFSGWSEIPTTMPAQNVTVTGTFTVNRYRLTYTLDGEEYSADSIAYGTPLVQKDSLTKEGYTFSGWSELPATMPAGDVTVTGTFTINKYLLTFVSDGEILMTDSVTYGTALPIPTSPEKEGYTFSGWGEVAEVMPAQDLTYTAIYTLNEEQTDGQGLTYLLNGTKDAFAVSGYTDALVADVVVPEELYGLPVNAMLNGALEDADVKSIVLPANVAGVGAGAFSGCRNLLVVEWNATAPLLAECFDDAEEYGNMLVFATGAASSVTFEGNVVTDGIAEEITLTDGVPFRNPKQFTARHISYSREFTKKTKVGMAGGWEGIMLPFKVQTISHEEKGALSPFGAETEGLPCWIAEWQASSKTFALSHSNLANQPFIMEVPNSEDYEEEFNIEGKVTFEAENTIVYATTDMLPVTGNGYSLQGTYEGVDADSYVYALNEAEYVSDDNGETFLPGGVFVANSRSIRPFEAYVHNNQLTRSRYLPVQGSTAQGIDRLLLKDAEGNGDDAWYTLQGVRLNGKPMQKGLYIHGSRVVRVR